MNDVFVEQIVKRKVTMGGILLRILSVVLFLIAFASILFLGLLGITITILIGYVVYMVWIYTKTELEYDFLNGELSVDKILGERSRKHVADYDIKKAIVVAPADSEEVLRASNNALTIDYKASCSDYKTYAIIIPDAEGKKGTLKVLFSPSEKVIDAMYHMRPNIVKK